MSGSSDMVVVISVACVLIANLAALLFFGRRRELSRHVAGLLDSQAADVAKPIVPDRSDHGLDRTTLAKRMVDKGFFGARLPEGTLFVANAGEGGISVKLNSGWIVDSSVSPDSSFFGCPLREGRYSRLHVVSCGLGDCRIFLCGDLVYEAAWIDSSGFGEVTVDGGGMIGNLDIVSSGAGRVHCEACPCGEVTVDSQGGGDVDVNVHGKLSVRMSGQGDVRALGYPNCSKSVANAGQGDFKFSGTFRSDAVSIAISDAENLRGNAPEPHKFDLLSFFGDGAGESSTVVDRVLPGTSCATQKGPDGERQAARPSSADLAGARFFFERECGASSANVIGDCLTATVRRLTIDKPGWGKDLVAEAERRFPSLAGHVLVVEESYVKVCREGDAACPDDAEPRF